VKGFGGHDTRGNTQNVLRLNEWRGTKICTGANRLKDGADCNETCDILDGKVVSAGGDGHYTGRCDGFDQKLHVSCLIGCDELKIAEERGVKACGDEVLLSERDKSFLVEGVFKMLKLVNVSAKLRTDLRLMSLLSKRIAGL
jgi:hypothetical protein